MVGLIGKKVGMTQVFDEQGTLTPVTVVEFEKNVVLGARSKDKNGYEACVVGAFDVKVKRVSKPYAGQFSDGITPKKTLAEFRDSGKDLNIGDEIGVEIFDGVSHVDVTASSKGKGYQGVMKRHGFSGGRKTHGSKFHRGNGSTGMAAWPSKVIKGTKMAGRMGGCRVTNQNLAIVKVDTDNQLLLLQGTVPGPKDGIVIVNKAKKK